MNQKMRPILIWGKQDLDENNIDIALRHDQFYYFHTDSVYTNKGSTLFFVQNIVRPYIESIRTEKKNLKLSFALIMDGLSSHNN